MAHHYELDSVLPEEGNSSQSWEEDTSIIHPTAPLYDYEPNQEPLNAPPPAYNSLFDTAKAFPKTIRKTILGQSQSKNNHEVDRNESEEANDDAEENKDQNNDSDDDEPDTFCGYLCLIVAVNIIFCGLPIAQIIMGFIYKDECNIDDKIPLFLLVNGIVFTLIWQQLWIPTKGCSETLLAIFNGAVGLFLLAWFICGSVWVFKAKSSVLLYNNNAIDIPIEGNFKSKIFSIVTRAPLTSDQMSIQWEHDSYWNKQDPSKLNLAISYHSLKLCNQTRQLSINDMHVFKIQDVWTFYISSSRVRIWLNDKIAFEGTKYDERYKDCEIWEDKLDTIKAVTGPVQSLQTYDKKGIYAETAYYRKCNKKVYNFAFWMLVIIYIIVGVLFLGVVLL